jgi:hypothetical protein
MCEHTTLKYLLSILTYSDLSKVPLSNYISVSVENGHHTVISLPTLF